MNSANNQKLIEREGYVTAKVGERFSRELNEIKVKRMERDKSSRPISTAKITNMLTRHGAWEKIKEDLIKAEEQEIEKFAYKG